MSMETYTRLLMDANPEFPIHFLNIYSDVALSGRACRPSGDESRVASAHLGRHTRDRHGPPGVCPGDSGGLGRHGGRATVSRDGGPAGVSLARGGRAGGPVPPDGGP